jgi:hypothetical protein
MLRFKQIVSPLINGRSTDSGKHTKPVTRRLTTQNDIKAKPPKAFGE